MANTPPAEATPTSKSNKAFVKIIYVKFVPSLTGQPPVVIKISANIDRWNIISIIITIAIDLDK